MAVRIDQSRYEQSGVELREGLPVGLLRGRDASDRAVDVDLHNGVAQPPLIGQQAVRGYPARPFG